MKPTHYSCPACGHMIMRITYEMAMVNKYHESKLKCGRCRKVLIQDFVPYAESVTMVELEAEEHSWTTPTFEFESRDREPVDMYFNKPHYPWGNDDYDD